MKTLSLAIGLFLAAGAAQAAPAGLFRDAVIQAVETCRLAKDAKPMDASFAAIGFAPADAQTYLRRVQGQAIAASLRPGACTVSFTTQIGDFEQTLQAITDAAAAWTPALKTYDYRRPVSEGGRRGLRTSIGWQSPGQTASQRLVIHEPETRASRPQYLLVYAWED